MKRSVVLLVALVFSIFIVSFASAAINDGLVGHWTFDEGSGTTASDFSGNGNIGTLVNGPTWIYGAEAKVGSGALSFDGVNDYVETSSVNGNSYSSFSYSFWFKTTASATFLSWGSSSCRMSGNGAHRVNCYIDSSGSQSATAGQNSDDGIWHHIVYVYTPSNQIIYQDGAQSGVAAETLSSLSTVIRLGRLQSGSTGYLSGLLDDVRIYNRALSQADVTELYALSGDTSPVVNGLCGSAAKTYTSSETFPSGTYCSSGSANPTSVANPAMGSSSSWDCLGSSGGISVSCFASRAQESSGATLVTPRLLVANPAALWYGGPNNQLGYDILNLALTRDINIVDRVKVEWSSDGSTWMSNTNTYTPDISISVPALPYNIRQYYRIRAVDGTKYSDYSNILSVVSLYPPSGLSAVAKTKSSVSLTWDYRGAKDQSSQEYELLPGSGYKVERSTDPNFLANIKTYIIAQPYSIITNPNNPTKKLVSFTDDDSFTSSLYYYRVRAFTTVGDGETSKIVSVAPNRLPEPVSYSATYMTKDSTNGKSSNIVAITFTSYTSGQTGYRIERSDDGVNGWVTLKQYGIAIPGSPYLDSGLVAGRTYYYRVVAINDVGDSSYQVLKVSVPNIPSIVTTQWYVDNQITGGANDGTSWANAWRDFSSINWYSIKPGDTIYLSGGQNAKTYYSPLYVMKGGANGSPVTIKTGTEVIHRGKVIIQNGAVLRAPWVTLNGEKDLNFNFGGDLEDISNNQNIEISNSNDNSCIYSSAPEGTKILWINMHDCGLSNGPQSLGGNTAGVLFNGNSGIGILGAEIAYSYIHDIWGSGIGISGPANNYGLASIHHNIVEHVHNDFILTSGGVDIYNNLAHSWIAPGIGHPDGFQIWAPYIRIYNNIIYDTPGTLIYVQLQLADSKHVQIFNNVMYPDATVENSAITFTTIANGVTLSDVLVANNIVYNLNKGQLTLNVQPNISPLAVRRMSVKNNIFYLPTNPSNSGNIIDFRNFDYITEDIAFDHNILAGTGSLGIGYKGISYSSPTVFNVAFPQYNHNSAGVPKMVDPTRFDFRLQSTDSTALNKGADLSLFCSSTYGWSNTNCPLKADILDTLRAQDAAWDIGAYEYVSGQQTGNIGDINTDRTVNIFDLMIIVNDYGKSSGFDPSVDLVKDNFIDLKDIMELVRYWGIAY